MAESAYVAGIAIQNPEVLDSSRHSALVRVTHWIHTLSFLALVVSGIGILLAHPRFYWGETGAVGMPSLFDLPLPFLVTTPTYVGPSSWGRSLHFLSAWICVLTGLLYAISGLLSGHFRKNLLPVRSQLSGRSISLIVSNHLRMKRPSEEESLTYNVLQRLAYLTVVFLLFPLMIWTGLAMSPSIASVFPILVIALHGQQSARTIHFFIANFLVLFLLVHIAMVCLAGFTRHVRAMITGQSVVRKQPLLSRVLSRRELITTGSATAAGVSGLGVAAVLAERYGLVPPDHGGIFGVGGTMTYAAQRILMSRHSLAREFDRSQISRVAPINGKPPENETYQRLLAGGFQDWRLTVDGLVARPASFSLAELKRFPSRTQITHQACEEGWSFIAEWTGVQLSTVLNLVGVRPEAKYVVYFSLDESWWDSLDMSDALHPQTFLAYGMNGRELPTDHGAPVRMRVARQLGFKSVKHLTQITVTDTLKNVRDSLGSSGPAIGYSWYGGI